MATPTSATQRRPRPWLYWSVRAVAFLVAVLGAVLAPIPPIEQHRAEILEKLLPKSGSLAWWQLPLANRVAADHKNLRTRLFWAVRLVDDDAYGSTLDGVLDDIEDERRPLELIKDVANHFAEDSQARRALADALLDNATYRRAFGATLIETTVDVAVTGAVYARLERLAQHGPPAERLAWAGKLYEHDRERMPVLFKAARVAMSHDVRPADIAAALAPAAKDFGGRTDVANLLAKANGSQRALEVAIQLARTPLVLNNLAVKYWNERPRLAYRLLREAHRKAPSQYMIRRNLRGITEEIWGPRTVTLISCGHSIL